MSNSSPRIVADASTVINLNATRCAAEILRAYPKRVAVVNIVRDELEEGRPKGRTDVDLLDELAANGDLELVRLGDVGEAVFERLVVGPAGATVDDGEAATIAYAVEHALGVVIDDRKARRICADFFGGVTLRCTGDIFRHELVEKALGRERLSNAVLSALQLARMRVLADHLAWVVELIGEDRARACPSLPRRK